LDELINKIRSMVKLEESYAVDLSKNIEGLKNVVVRELLRGAFKTR